jgi:hypothetical protein
LFDKKKKVDNTGNWKAAPTQQHNYPVSSAPANEKANTNNSKFTNQVSAAPFSSNIQMGMTGSTGKLAATNSTGNLIGKVQSGNSAGNLIGKMPNTGSTGNALAGASKASMAAIAKKKAPPPAPPVKKVPKCKALYVLVK